MDNLTVAYFCNSSARRLLCQTQALFSPIRFQNTYKLKRIEYERRACKREEEKYIPVKTTSEKLIVDREMRHT